VSGVGGADGGFLGGGIGRISAAGERRVRNHAARSHAESFFIPSGRTVSSPAERVGNGRMKFLLNRLEPLFDRIIIDSPPAIPVSDAGLLANYCDGVLILVRSNATSFDIARKARQEFRDKHLVLCSTASKRDPLIASITTAPMDGQTARGRPRGRA